MYVFIYVTGTLHFVHICVKYLSLRINVAIRLFSE